MEMAREGLRGHCWGGFCPPLTWMPASLPWWGSSTCFVIWVDHAWMHMPQNLAFPVKMTGFPGEPLMRPPCRAVILSWEGAAGGRGGQQVENTGRLSRSMTRAVEPEGTGEAVRRCGGSPGHGGSVAVDVCTKLMCHHVSCSPKALQGGMFLGEFAHA